MKRALFLLTILISMPAYSQQVTETTECIRTREIYIPGNYNDYGAYQPGRIDYERYRVPCYGDGVAPVARYNYNNNYNNYNRYNNYNNRYVRTQRCEPTPSLLGGLLGGGIAAGVSKKSAYAWSVPIGAAVGGALFGCT
jgi:hypothetical protein